MSKPTRAGEIGYSNILAYHVHVSMDVDEILFFFLLKVVIEIRESTMHDRSNWFGPPIGVIQMKLRDQSISR